MLLLCLIDASIRQLAITLKNVNKLLTVSSFVFCSYKPDNIVLFYIHVSPTVGNLPLS